MSFAVNVLVLGGNLTRDPESRYTPKGTCVCEFGLAVNRRWNTEAGEAKEEVSFFDCVAFGRTAELIVQYYRKGKPFLMSKGRIKQETWEDRQTQQNRSKVKVIVEEICFLPINEGNREGSDAPQGNRNPPPARNQPPATHGPAARGRSSNANTDYDSGPPPEDDDVPF